MYGSMVVYADGHTAWVTGTTVWLEAQRLSKLSKAMVRDQGIEWTDWSLTPEGGPFPNP